MTKIHHLRRQRYRKKQALTSESMAQWITEGTLPHTRKTWPKAHQSNRHNKKIPMETRKNRVVELIKTNNHNLRPKTASTSLMDPLNSPSRSIDLDNNQLLQSFFADCLPSRKASRSALACHQVLNLSALLHCIQLASAATTRACNARSVFVSNRIVPQSKGAWIK